MEEASHPGPRSNRFSVLSKGSDHNVDQPVQGRRTEEFLVAGSESECASTTKKASCFAVLSGRTTPGGEYQS